MLLVLIACEESQRMCTEFRRLGHKAYSCDLLDPSGGHPEWHIKGDVTPLLNGNCTFETMSGELVQVLGKWDLIIGHPECTYLTTTGNRWFNEEKYGDAARKRKSDREDAVRFFMQIANADCDHIAIENPVGIMSTRWRKPDQIFQPYIFGDPFEKKTCLWLKNLPVLTPTNIVEPPPRQILSSGKTMPRWYSNCGGDRHKARSRTFPGFARAAAEQWGGYIQAKKLGLEMGETWWGSDALRCSVDISDGWCDFDYDANEDCWWLNEGQFGGNVFYGEDGLDRDLTEEEEIAIRWYEDYQLENDIKRRLGMSSAEYVKKYGEENGIA